MLPTALMRKMRSLPRRFRQAKMIARALKSHQHPIYAQIGIPIRRCRKSLPARTATSTTKSRRQYPRLTCCTALIGVPRLGRRLLRSAAVNRCCIPTSTN